MQDWRGGDARRFYLVCEEQDVIVVVVIFVFIFICVDSGCGSEQEVRCDSKQSKIVKFKRLSGIDSM